MNICGKQQWRILSRVLGNLPYGLTGSLLWRIYLSYCAREVLMMQACMYALSLKGRCSVIRQNGGLCKEPVCAMGLKSGDVEIDSYLTRLREETNTFFTKYNTEK